MRHPFDGIIVPQSRENQSTTRREALTLLVGAGAASLAAGVAGAQEGSDGPVKKEGELAEPPAEQKYHLYYVVPKEVRLFDARRRMDLNVRGELLPGLPEHKELADKQGFLAWLSDEEAAKAKAAEDVTTFHKIEPADVMVQGKPPEKGVATLRVYAAPMGWRTPPARESYLDLAELGKLWSAKFAMKDGVTVIANGMVRQPFIQFAEGKVADEILDELKSQPQVYALQWLTPMAVATKRVGEDGIVTTDALREEAATTLALGEEGATTGAIGEEGASTEAVGEEGGVTTFAIGEEGGSTERLGEEGATDAKFEDGAGPSTMAEGEEGGAKPSTRAIGEEGATTRGRLEEGGGITRRIGEDASTGVFREEGGGESTRALGEEGGRLSTEAEGEEGARLTTKALGEEGGDGGDPRHKVTSLALGEEGGEAPMPVPEPKIDIPAVEKQPK